MALLSVDKCQFKLKTGLPSELSKQSRQGKPLTDYFAHFPDNKQLCPVETLQQYLQVRQILRKNSSRLFVAIVKSHKPIAHCAIAF